MATKAQGKAFKEYIFDDISLLSASIDWINNSLKPEDVFDPVKLHQWAQENGYARPMVSQKEAQLNLAQMDNDMGLITPEEYKKKVEEINQLP